MPRFDRPTTLLTMLAASGGLTLSTGADVLFDNGDPNGVGGTSNATSGVFGFRRSLLDDFVVPEGETWRIEQFHHRHVWGTPMGGAMGVGVELAIWRDIEGEPWHREYDLTLIGYLEKPTGGLFFSREEMESWSTVRSFDLGPGRYWIDVAIMGPENNFWLTADGGGSESWVNFEDLGGLIPSTSQFGVPRDYSFSLEGSRVEPLRFEYPGGAPEVIPPCGDSVRIVITAPAGVPLDPESATLHYDAGGGFATVPLERISLAVYDIIFPAIECGSEIEFYVSAQTTAGDTFTDPPEAPTRNRGATSATGLVTVFEDDMEEDRGWTVENEGVTAGEWERGVPIGSFSFRRDPPEDADGSGQAWVTGLAQFEDVDNGATRLLSPVFDADDAADLLISYHRWFSSGAGRRLDVELSNDDGKTWVLAEEPPSRIWWIDRTVRAASLLPPTAEMRIRFSAEESKDNHTEAGVDGVRVVRVECNVGFPGDIDRDGDVDFQDLLGLLILWGPCDPPEDCPGDFDGSGAVDFGDIVILLSAWQPCGDGG